MNDISQNIHPKGHEWENINTMLCFLEGNLTNYYINNLSEGGFLAEMMEAFLQLFYMGHICKILLKLRKIHFDILFDLDIGPNALN